MRAKLFLATFLVTWSSVAHAAVTVYTDTVVADTHTLVLEAFNDGVLGHDSVTADDFGTIAESNGVATYETLVGALDPQMIFQPHTPTFITAVNQWARLRARGSIGNGQFFRWPPQGGTAISFTPYSTTGFSESRGIFPAQDSTVRTGFRFDPVANGISTSHYDYIMLDLSETVGLGEWDRVGDLQGWTTANIGTVLITNSTLGGAAINLPTGDAQLNTAATLNADTFKFLEIRIKSQANSQLFWDAPFSGTRSVTFGPADNQWHVYVLDFSAEATWTGAGMRVRLDPVAGVGNTFEIDYIRARATAYGVAIAFTNDTDTAWATAGNWSRNRTPGTGDTTTIGGGRTAIVSTHAGQVGAAVISSGTLGVTSGGSLVVDGDVSVGDTGTATLDINSNGTLGWSGELRAHSGNGTVRVSGSAASINCTRNDGGNGITLEANTTLAATLDTGGISPITLGFDARCAIDATATLTLNGHAYTGGARTLPLITHLGYAAGLNQFGTTNITGFGGMEVEIQYNANAVDLVLTAVESVPVLNPSFEAETFEWPGKVNGESITGWSHTGNPGINPASTGADPNPFANNGVIPDQGHVAFIQNVGSLIQGLSGLDTESTYWLQLWFNARDFQARDAHLQVSFAGTLLIPDRTVSPVQAAGQFSLPYHFTNVVFTPSAAGGNLVLENTNGDDQSLLLDGICVLKRDGFEVMLKNPGFEASGTTPDVGYTAAISGWTCSTSGTGVNTANQPFYDNGIHADGHHVGFLQGTGSYVMQNVDSLIVGQRYTLSFAYNARAGSPCHLQVTADALTLVDADIASLQAAGTYSIPFAETNATFSATASTMTLRFENTQVGDTTALIDSIHLRGLPDAGTLFILR